MRLVPILVVVILVAVAVNPRASKAELEIDLASLRSCRRCATKRS